MSEKQSIAGGTGVDTKKQDEGNFSDLAADPGAYAAKAFDGSDVYDAAKGLPIAGSGIKTVESAVKNFGNAKDFGDLAAASGQLALDGAGFVAGCATDLAGFVTDPVGWLVSNGLNFLLELIQPLQDMLHFVTGDGPSLGEASDNFGKIANGFGLLAVDFVTTRDDKLREWQGDAADAVRKGTDEFAAGIHGIGETAGAVAQTLKMWSMVMTVIEEVVKSIISEFVSFLIYIWLPALAASIVSFGSSVAGAMATSIGKLTSVVSKITAKMGKLGKLLDKFMEFLTKWADKLVKASEKMKAAKGGDVLAGALAKDMDKVLGGVYETRLGLTGHAALDTLKNVGTNAAKSAVKQAVGFNPADAGKTPFHTGKAVVDGTKKAIEHGKTAGYDDNTYTEDQTRENLDI